MKIEDTRERELQTRIRGVKQLFDIVFAVGAVSEHEYLVEFSIATVGNPNVFCQAPRKILHRINL